MSRDSLRASELFDDMREVLRREDNETVRAASLSLLMFDFCATHEDPEAATRVLMNTLTHLIECYEGGVPGKVVH